MLASGYPTSVGYWTRSFPIPTRRTAYNVLNPMGRKAWRKDGPTDGKCVWEMHGVWGYDVLKKEGVVLRENYFVKHPMTGKKVAVSPPTLPRLTYFDQVDWYTDFYFPFVRRWAERVSRYTANGKHKLLFLEPIPNEVTAQTIILRTSLTSVFQFCPSSWTPDRQPKNMVYSPHWYDLHALFNKAFGDLTYNVQGLSQVWSPPKSVPLKLF